MDLNDDLDIRENTDRILPYFPRPVGAGVYAIINRGNCKIYVGSAKNIGARWREHRMELLRGDHHSRHLQRSFSKSPSDFEFVVIEQVSDKNQLLAREQFWIDFYESANHQKGYNISPKSSSCAGIKRSPELREKYAALLAGHKKTQKYKDAVSAARKASIGLKHPSRSELFRKKMSEIKKGTKISLAHKKALLDGLEAAGLNRRPVVQLSSNGHPVKLWKSIGDAEASLGCQRGDSNIPYVCNGKRKFALGWKWTYYDGSELTFSASCLGRVFRHNQRQIAQLDKSGNELLTFESITSAARFHKCVPQNISNALVNNKTAVGFLWKYV